MELNLTRASQNKLMNWHEGSGYAYLSEGRNSYKGFFFQFLNKNGTYYLSLGNSKSIKLTPEQIAVIGGYAVEEID